MVFLVLQCILCLDAGSHESSVLTLLPLLRSVPPTQPPVPFVCRRGCLSCLALLSAVSCTWQGSWRGSRAGFPPCASSLSPEYSTSTGKFEAAVFFFASCSVSTIPSCLIWIPPALRRRLAYMPWCIYRSNR